MEKQEEKNSERVFVLIGQVWQKGEAMSVDNETFKIKTANHPPFKLPKNNDNLEIIEIEGQEFAKEDLKRRLEGAYISYGNLDKNIRESILKGKEQLIKTTYISDGKLKDSVKMVQMIYSSTYGSRLDVQIKRNEQVKLEDASAYQYQFTKEEYNVMLKEGKTVLFTGTSLSGDKFPKFAYYEPRLNDIRTKSAVSANQYVLGQQLTKEQADTMNKGEETKITIPKSKKGPLTYMVRWSIKGQRFLYRDPEKTKAKEVGKIAQKTVEDLKKKRQPNNAISM